MPNAESMLTTWTDARAIRHWGVVFDGVLRSDAEGILIGEDRPGPILQNAMGKRIRMTLEVLPYVDEG